MRATLRYLAKKTGGWKETSTTLLATYFPEVGKKLSFGDSIRQELAFSDKVFIQCNMNDEI
jgi:hypothetical protein